MLFGLLSFSHHTSVMQIHESEDATKGRQAPESTRQAEMTVGKFRPYEEIESTKFSLVMAPFA